MKNKTFPANKFGNFEEVLLVHLTKLLASTKKDWRYILPPTLKKDLEKGKNYFLLDTRRPQDFKECHIQGAKNIFWLDILKKENLKKLPRNKRIIICCYVGHTASQILIALALLGYKVSVLKFGMGKSPVVGVPVAGWLNYGFDVVKD
ncbi:MAG: rhodanese-like domain-containing protein [Patescibacteria group bacterium]